MEKFKNIEDFLEKNDIHDYTIEDGLINTNESVILSNVYNGEIPFPFGHVGSDFNCAGLGLTTLKNTPKSVEGYFDCGENKISSFEHVTQNVPDYFISNDNLIQSFKYLPKKIERLYLQNNNIEDLKDFDTIFKYISLNDNPISLIVGDFPKYDDLLAFKSLRIIDGKKVNFKRLKYGLYLIGKSNWLNSSIYTDEISSYYDII